MTDAVADSRRTAHLQGEDIDTRSSRSLELGTTECMSHRPTHTLRVGRTGSMQRRWKLQK